MDYRVKLCFCRDIYDLAGSNRSFMEAVRRNVDCHLLKYEDYWRILEGRDFSRSDGTRVTNALEVVPDVLILPGESLIRAISCRKKK